MTPCQLTMPVSRRAALAGLSAGGLGLALAATAHPADAQEASPAPAAPHAIVGTWVLHFDPGPPAPLAPTVTIFGSDGSFIDAGEGHAGVWEASGPTTVLATWVHVFPQNNNYIAVSGTITLDPSGDTWTQPYSLMVVSATGKVLRTGHGTAHGQRLHAVPEDEIGRPLAVVPTWTPASATPTT